jgi:glycerol uptake operon antiterminator
MYKIITMLSNISNVPLIAGGLISDKEDVISALAAGATAISSTDTGIWKL